MEISSTQRQNINQKLSTSDLQISQFQQSQKNDFSQKNKQYSNKQKFMNKLIIFFLILFLMALIIVVILGIQYINEASILSQQKNRQLSRQINELKSNQQTLTQQILKQFKLSENKLVDHIDLSFKQNLKQKQKQQCPKQNIFNSSVKQYQMIKFKFSKTSNVSAVFTTCCGRHLFLQQTLRTSAQYNTYPLKKVIVVNDGQMNLQLVNILKKVQNIILINTLTKVGQLISIDEAYSLVDTPYVFHSEDDWAMIRSGFIEEDIKMLQSDPKILMLWNQQHWPDQVQGQKLQWDSQWNGFSLNPTIIRMQLYKKLPGGYQQLTKNMSYGKGAGRAQLEIIKHYKEQGYYIWTAKQNYFKHLGQGSGNPSYW